jgi:phospholipid-translocating ATPase
LKLYDESRGPAVVNNTQIPDELGQVQFVLSDKTGTLTENVMNLRKCSISGKRYGSLQQDIWESEALMMDMDEMESSVTENPLLRNSVESNTFLDNMSLFFQSISLCHDSQLIPLEDSEVDIRTDHEYYGSSPDEVALLNSAAKLGYRYLEETHDGTITLDAHGKTQTYELLHRLDFCSFRKRMSVLVRVSKDSPIWLICKGADDSVVPLCKSVPLPMPFHQESSTSITQLHLDEYAHLGLRTLAIACKPLSEDEYKQWLNKFETANSSIEDREEQIRQSFIDIEKDLNLIGCTAIEDKLQPGVPDTIASLRQAGVKVWMLTGDKLITAIQIGRSCKLLPPEGFGRIIKLQGRDQTFEEFFENFEDEYSQLSSNIPDISIRSRLSLGLLSSTSIQNDISLASMIVDGTGLAYILSDFRLKSMFVELGLRVNSVICCRATPKQKSQVVELIKSLNQITLAIGDGGNDVLMIQQANIGVGIRGLEGKQATRAADITLSRFAHLNRLILIHGRYSLHRVRFVALYCFYKTVYICCIQAAYQFFSGFNGTSLFNTYSLSLYNILYAGMPVLFYVLDKDIPEEQLIKYPTLYKFTQGRDPSYWFISGTFRWFLWAVGQGIVTIIVSYGSFFEFTDTWFSSSDSMVIDSFLMYSIVIIIIQITLSLFTNYYTIVNQFVIWGTIIIYFVTTLLASIPVKLHMSEVQQLVMDTRFYLCIMLTVVICSVPVWVYNYFKLVSGKDPVKELRNSVISVRPRTVAHS